MTESKRGKSLARLAGAILLTLIATTGAKLAFPDVLAHGTPFLLYFAPILVAAFVGGLSVGLVTTVLSAGLAIAFFMDSPWTATFTDAHALARLGGFLVEGAAISLVGAHARRARAAAAAAFEDARSAAAKLAVVLDNVDEGITMQDGVGRLLYANEPAARSLGFSSAGDLLAAPLAEIVARYQMLDEKGAPLGFDQLPGRIALREGKATRRLVRFLDRTSGVERWSLVGATAVDGTDGGRLAVNVFRDVTAERQADEAVRISREWFETALRSIGDAVIATDAVGVVTFMNPCAEELTGWPLAEATGRPLAEVFPIVNEATRAASESPFDVVLREGSVAGLTSHTVLVRRDGSERAIDDSAAPIRRPNGDLVGVVLVFRDVTAERRARDRDAFLAEATSELAASLDVATTLASITRLAVPRVADWAAVDLVEEGQIRRLAVAHIDPEKCDLVREIEERYPRDPNAERGVANIIRTGQPEMMAVIPPELIAAGARDSEHLDLLQRLALHSYIGVPLTVGRRTIGAIVFATAESHRRYDAEDLAFAVALAERAAIALDNARLFREVEVARGAIEAERRRLHELILAAPAAIALLRGPDHVIELVNGPFRALVGGDDPSGRLAHDLTGGALDHDTIDRVFATGATVRRPEVAVPVGPDGTVRTLDITFQATRDADGAIDGVLIFALDVSDQVEARRRVDSARLDAEVANRSKDEFLAILGHELRNPLAPILTALELMDLRAGGAVAHERTVIERQVKHVVRLVDDLLDVSRITGGKVELRRELLAVDDLVARALEMSEPLLEARHHHVDVSIEDGLKVEGDAIRLAQVVANIFNNAAKYTEIGGCIRICGRREVGWVVVSVQDSGIGIAPEMLPGVFDLFSQESQALDRAQGGLGLGLAIVKSLVTLHGGDVTALSDGPDRGSTFVIRLPAPPSSSQRRPTPRRIDRTPAGFAERILVVDDNSDACDLLADALNHLGHQVWCAADGPEALRIATTALPTVALLDIGLPVMDGYQLARRLRALAGLNDLKLVAVTGYGQSSDRHRSEQAGFDAHLVKPITIDLISATLASLTRS
jgi:PAS domain S-box-containing protein